MRCSAPWHGSAPFEAAPRLRVDFCGEWLDVAPPDPFVIGREGDLAVDDNPYLHRSFLRLYFDRYWWLENVGSALAATVSDGDGAMHAWFAPGAALPLLFGVTEVRFTAGPTNYLLTLHLDEPVLQIARSVANNSGCTTLYPTNLTDNQRLVVLALAERALIERPGAANRIPTSAEAAKRLGWTLTKFNRQLDAVCQKLSRTGVRGLHGGPGRLAAGRRSRLVEYALAVRLVTVEDLPLLERERMVRP
ncbi:hypothetical protein [Rhabdothermincola sediminis]|uniref:hypothetical protein n=1 Tax=Rhabdothermincola sediminis TaxID=2751370 RepID=UPI001AA0223D|nr:hypothetical protein [Rhabdothermincola sediminis]